MELLVFSLCFSRIISPPAKGKSCFFSPEGSSHGKQIFFFFPFLRPRLWPMEVARLGVKSGLQLPAYTTATATPDLSHI